MNTLRARLSEKDKAAHDEMLRLEARIKELEQIQSSYKGATVLSLTED